MTLRSSFSSIALLIIFVVLFCSAFVFADPTTLWGWHSMRIPQASVLLLLGTYLLCWHLLPYKAHRKKIHLGAALLLLFLYFYLHVDPTLGDTWTMYKELTLDDAFIPASAILSSVLYALSLSIFAADSFISPLVGFLSALLIFKIIDLLSTDDYGVLNERKAVLGNTLYLGTVIHLLFFNGYDEMTQVSIPAILASIYFGIRYLRDIGAGEINAILFGSFLIVAGLIHGANTFFLPLVPIVFAWKLLEQKRYSTFVRVTGIFVALLFIIPAIVMSITTFWGYYLFVGDVYGGGDNTFFLTLSTPFERYERYTMFSVAHFREVGNILLLAAPFTVPVGILAILRFRQALTFFKEGTTLLLSFGALAYCSLLLLHNMDLGYPKDLDLMLTMSIPLFLLCIYAVLRFCTLKTGYVLAACSILFSWGYLTTFLMGRGLGL